MIAFRVGFRQSYVFVHVECKYVLETYASLFVCLDQCLVHPDGGGSGGQAQYKWFFRSGLGGIDLVYYIICCPL